MKSDEIIKKHWNGCRDEDGNPVYYDWSVKDAMIEFAKMHVEAALKEASEKATWDKETRETWFGDMNKDECDFESTDGDGVPYELHKVVINKDSILNSYPLENIK